MFEAALLFAVALCIFASSFVSVVSLWFVSDYLRLSFNTVNKAAGISLYSRVRREPGPSTSPVSVL